MYIEGVAWGFCGKWSGPPFVHTGSASYHTIILIDAKRYNTFSQEAWVPLSATRWRKEKRSAFSWQWRLTMESISIIFQSGRVFPGVRWVGKKGRGQKGGRGEEEKPWIRSCGTFVGSFNDLVSGLSEDWVRIASGAGQSPYLSRTFHWQTTGVCAEQAFRASYSPHKILIQFCLTIVGGSTGHHLWGTVEFSMRNCWILYDLLMSCFVRGLSQFSSRNIW